MPSSSLTHAIPADPALIRSLAKFWPHREHESSAIKNMFLLYWFAPLEAAGFEPVLSGERNTVLLLVPEDLGRRRHLSSLTRPGRKWKCDSDTPAPLPQIFTTQNRTMAKHR
jgi:hypothetical protein